MDPAEFHRWFNFAEAALWALIGLGFLAATIRGRKYTLLPALLFLAFGASDYVETFTGNWYEPWWLGVWKIVNGAGLAYCWWRHRKLQRPRAPLN